MIVRGKGLGATMSRYLIDRIEGLANVEVLTQTQITGISGHDGILETVRWRDAKGHETERRIRHLFLQIGADPNADWLANVGIARDNKGFILTGSAAGNGRSDLETSVPGVFAIGDVRSGSTKRVARRGRRRCAGCCDTACLSGGKEYCRVTERAFSSARQSNRLPP